MSGGDTRTRGIGCIRRIRPVWAAALAVAALVAAGPALTGCQQAKEARAKAGALAASARQRPRAAENARTGPTATDGAGRTVATVTVTNRGDRPADYTVWVNFRDPDGNLLDAVVLDVEGVGPGAEKSGTARSNRALVLPAGRVARAEVAQALRH